MPDNFLYTGKKMESSNAERNHDEWLRKSFKEEEEEVAVKVEEEEEDIKPSNQSGIIKRLRAT